MLAKTQPLWHNYENAQKPLEMTADGIYDNVKCDEEKRLCLGLQRK